MNIGTDKLQVMWIGRKMTQRLEKHENKLTNLRAEVNEKITVTKNVARRKVKLKDTTFPRQVSGKEN